MEEQHQDFLEENHFPVTRLYTNPGFSQNPMVKINIIRSIIKRTKPSIILFIGDNGQMDTEIYDQLSREFEMIPSRTYIREAYSHRGYSNFPTKRNQIGFVTTYELALDLNLLGVFQEQDLLWFEDLIARKIKFELFFKIIGELVFPRWKDCRDFRWQWSQPISENGKYILQSVVDRCHVNNKYLR